jgi:hypothetical protein
MIGEPGAGGDGDGYAAIWTVRAGFRPGLGDERLERSWGLPAGIWLQLTPSERCRAAGHLGTQAAAYAGGLAALPQVRWVTLNFDRLAED